MKKRFIAGLGGFLLFTGSFALAQTGESYDKALTAFNQGEVQESYILLKNVLSQNPDHLPAKLLMGRILLIDGYVGEAIDEFEEVLLAGADINLVIEPLSRAYLLNNQYDKIYELVRSNGLSNKSRLSIALIAGLAYQQEGKNEDALELYHRTSSDYPDSLPLTISYANLLTEMREFSKAEALIDAALQSNPSELSALLAQAKLAMAKGDTDQAYSLFKKAFDSNPENPAAMRAMAGAFAQRGEFENANTLIEKIEEQTPGDMQNMLLKARILALTNDQNAADKILSEMSERLSMLTDQQLNQRLELSLITGIVGYLNKNYTVAATEFTRYLAEREATPELLGMLIDSLLRVGYFKDAVKILERHENTLATDIAVSSLSCDLYISLNRSFKCVGLVEKLEKNFPGNADIDVIRAKLAVKEGKLSRALSLLEGELESRNDPQILLLRASILSSLDRFTEAEPYINALIELDKENVDYQLLLADNLIRTNKVPEAKPIVEAALKTNPESLAGLVTKARIAFSEKRLDEAARLLREALKVNKNSAQALLLAAQVAIRQQRNDDAINHLLTLKTVSKEDKRARALLVSIYKTQRDFKSAIAEINGLLAMDRLSAEYVLEKANILIAMGRFDEARDQLNVVTAMWADDPAKLVALSQVQRNARDAAGAIASLERAMQIAPEALMPKLEYARMLIADKRIDDAKKQIDALYRKEGETANIAFLRGQWFAAHGDQEAAMDAFLKAHSLAETFPAPLIQAYQLARDGVSRGQFIAYLEKVTATKAATTFNRHLLADTYYVNGDRSKALALYSDLITQSDLTNRHFVFNNLANLYATTDIKKALDYSEQALKIAPDSSALLDTKGWLLTLSDNYQAGLDTLRQAYTLNASDPSLHYHLAFTLNKLGRAAEAKEMLERHNTLDEPFPERTEAQKLYQQL